MTIEKLAEEFISLVSSSRDVFSYSDALRVLFARRGNEKIDIYRWRVEVITTYKDCTRISLHEYLVVQLRNSDTGKDIYLKLERVLRDPDPEDASPYLSTLVSSVSDHRAAQIVSGDKRAVDGVSIFRHQDLPARQIPVDEAFWHPDGRMSLPELIVLACTISRLVDARYHLLRNNCYWFAQAVVEALRVIKPQFEDCKEVQAGMRGYWHNVPMHEEIDAENIKKEFETDWGLFIRDIQGPNEALRAAEQQVHDLQKRVAELKALLSTLGVQPDA